MKSKSFAEALAEHRRSILRQWLEHVLRTYPESTAKFLSREVQPFRNPVGHALQNSLESLFDGLAQSKAIGELTPVLEDAIRIRAVQDFTPSQAIEFLFPLKQIIRSQFSSDSTPYSADIPVLEAKIDELALRAFDLYVKCREKMNESKANEIKRQAFILERINAKERLRER